MSRSSMSSWRRGNDDGATKHQNTSPRKASPAPTASPPYAACCCRGRAWPAKAARKGGGVQRSPSTPQLEDFMSKALFSLVVFVAVLAIAPFAHSATASEVRPTSPHQHACTQQHSRLVIRNGFLSPSSWLPHSFSSAVVLNLFAGPIAVPASCRPARFVNSSISLLTERSRSGWNRRFH